jgi:hypothetical protein
MTTPKGIQKSLIEEGRISMVNSTLTIWKNKGSIVDHSRPYFI